MIDYTDVLLATDFSETARLAAAHAVTLAKDHDATLRLLHVVEEFSYWESFDLKHFPSEEVSAELEENAGIALFDLVEEEGLDADASVEVVVRQGKPFVEIVRAAREFEIDVLVVGSHGQTGLAETLFGSTAEKVVRKAPCSVLVVRHPDHEFRLP